MEDVLEVYTRPYDKRFAQVCLDEKSKQLVGEVRDPLSVSPGGPARYDYEYEREGTANLFIVSEPLAGWRHISVTERRTKIDWAHCIKKLVDVHYPEAEKIVLVLDNLNTHTPAALYEAFVPAEARRIARKLEIHYTPKHGRDRALGARSPVSGSAHPQPRNACRESGCVGSRAQRSRELH
jgi:hypothetical protein